MAIDTEIQETLKSNNQSIKNMRRGGSPEPSCQLPTAPAHSCLIPLTQGKFAIVDAKNYELLSKHRWFIQKNGNTYYAVQSKKDKLIYMHRQILNVPDGMLSDHINHNGLDNRECNIRICTFAENQHNQKPRKTGSSKYKGVVWSKRTQKFLAQIRFEKKTINLGYYDSEIEAAKAYDVKALELFGEFAYTNF